jgi:hypothetical protein
MINIIFLLPIIIQIIFGSIVIVKNKFISLNKLTLLNLILQILLSIILIIYNNNLIQKREIRCYNPMLAVFGLIIICFILIIIIFFIQLIVKYFYDKKNVNSSKPN